MKSKIIIILFLMFSKLCIGLSFTHIWGKITGKYRVDTIELPGSNTNNGWKWLSFPALDNVYSTPTYDPDQAYYLLYDILHPLPNPELNEVSAVGGPFVWRISGIWYGTDNIFSRTDGYKFHMNEAATLEVPGFKVADNTTIVLEGNNVENWVGYWLEETQHVSDAFSEYWNGNNITFIKAQYWSAVKNDGIWRYRVQHGYSPTLSYGDMVIVKCNTTISNFRWDNSTPEDPKTTFSEPQQFTYTEQADYVPLFIELNPEDMPQEIGAMVNGECIGATVVEDTLTQINAYTTSVPPGNIELELYYGSRSENKKLSYYHCVNFFDPDLVMTQISTKNYADAWFISLREDSSMIPTPDEMNLSNYPNPFNPATNITYSLPKEGKVNLKIYNVKGQIVRQLVEGYQSEGYYSVTWYGKDNAGKRVSSGIYYYRLNACGKTINKKMILLK